MSQGEIIEVLEKKEQATAEELSQILKISDDAVRMALNKLFRATEVERIKLTKEEVEARGISFSGRHFVWKLRIRK